MKAHQGDHIILAASHVDEPTRAGVVLEVRGKDGGPPFLVRWADGHTGLMYPGPGSVLRVLAEHEHEHEHEQEQVTGAPAGTPPGQRRQTDRRDGRAHTRSRPGIGFSRCRKPGRCFGPVRW